jgi:hypothetical protein
MVSTTTPAPDDDPCRRPLTHELTRMEQMNRRNLEKLLSLALAFALAGCAGGEAEDDKVTWVNWTPLPEGPETEFPKNELYRVEIQTFEIAVSPASDGTTDCIHVEASNETSPVIAVNVTATWDAVSLGAEGIQLVLREADGEIIKEGPSPLVVEIETTFDPSTDEARNHPSVFVMAKGPEPAVGKLIQLRVMAAYDGDEAPLMSLSRC